jgi:hypothetical protein
LKIDLLTATERWEKEDKILVGKSKDFDEAVRAATDKNNYPPEIISTALEAIEELNAETKDSALRRMLTSQHGDAKVCAMQTAALQIFLPAPAQGLLEYTPSVAAVEAASAGKTNEMAKMEAKMAKKQEGMNKMLAQNAGIQGNMAMPAGGGNRKEHEAVPQVQEVVATIADRDVDDSRKLDSPKRKSDQQPEKAAESKRAKTDARDMHSEDEFQSVPKLDASIVALNTFFDYKDIGILANKSIDNYTELIVAHQENANVCNGTESRFLKDYNDINNLVVFEVQKEIGATKEQVKANAEIFKTAIVKLQEIKGEIASAIDFKKDFLYTTWTAAIMSRLDEIIEDPPQAMEEQEKEVSVDAESPKPMEDQEPPLDENNKDIKQVTGEQDEL